MVDIEKEMIETLTKAYKHKRLSVEDVKELHERIIPPQEVPDAHKAWQKVTARILENY